VPSVARTGSARLLGLDGGCVPPAGPAAALGLAEGLERYWRASTFLRAAAGFSDPCTEASLKAHGRTRTVKCQTHMGPGKSENWGATFRGNRFSDCADGRGLQMCQSERPHDVAETQNHFGDGM